MQKLLRSVIILSLLTSASYPVLSAPPAAKPAPPTPTDDLLALLPASDLLGVVDAARAFTDLLPRLKSIWPSGFSGITKSLESFTSKTGIDPTQLKTAVLGVKLGGTGSGQGVVILQGANVDPKRVEAAVLQEKGEFKTQDYKGKAIYTVIPAPPPPPAPAPNATEAPKPPETPSPISFALLGNQVVALGDVPSIQSVLDAQATPPKTNPNAELGAVLKETKAGLIRFAAILPESLRQSLSGNGDLFKQIAAVKVIFGSFDFASDFSAALDTRLRTASASDASQLETSLKSLVVLAKSFLGQDQKLAALGQLLDQVTIAAQANDVAVRLAVPRALIDQLAK
jgi:hypothetical protein